MLVGIAMVVALAWGPAAAQQEFARGEVIPQVVTLADPSQSYALYLPADYDATKQWPVIYAFDPIARGKVPVELLREAAEKYGYVVIGSNNSRNGPVRAQVEAFQAMWNDAHRRFSLDDRRAYATGFSGGARAAATSATLCKCLAAIIAVGAGLSDPQGPTKELPFAVYAITGDEDFNFAELVRLRERLDELGLENELRVYSAQHQWAPAELMTEAVEWLELQAMRTGRKRPDAAFVNQQWELVLERARADEQRKDAYAAFHEYRRAARAFQGLRDTAAAEQKVAELQNAAAVKDARKQEQRDLEWQDRLTARVQGLIEAVKQPSEERARQLFELRSEVSTLKPRKKEESAVRARASAQVIATLYETGEQAARDADLKLAAALFEICTDLVPQAPGPHYQLARVHARAGKKKEALKELERAAELGLRGKARIAAEADLAPIRSEPRFQQVLAKIPE